MNRRDFLRTTVIGAGTAALSASVAPSPLRPALAATLAAPPRRLEATSRTIEVSGRSARVFGLVNGSGGPGLVLDEGEAFRVDLANATAEPTLVHWHGLKAPYPQDGVPDMPSPMLQPGEVRSYDFPVGPAGTHWMHAHTLQEQNLLAAPLIVRDAAPSPDEQEVVVLLHDFSFRPAAELLAGLTKGGGSMSHGMDLSHSEMGEMDMDDMSMDDMAAMAGPMRAMDLNDIAFDAYLANDRTLADPEIVKVERGGRVRLRLINGATATVFAIDTGTLEAEVVAVDGRPVRPVRGRRFPMAMGQRLDLRLALPNESRAFPILVSREGARERTGVILAPAGAPVERVDEVSADITPAMGYELESRLTAAVPLASRPADRELSVMLMGDMASYRWTMTASRPLIVRTGERVHVRMRNHSMMSHPMHLHGHAFQVIAINDEPLLGAVRDTVQMPPMTSLTIAFDADNVGRWAFHCHNLYHMASGMMAFIAYDGVT